MYVNGTVSQPIRDQTDPIVRTLEREMAGLQWLNPYTGSVESNIMVGLADHTGMKALHMVTADPFRTPTFTPFADPNWFFFATGGLSPASCATPAACAFIPARTSQSFAWNHGDIQDEIASTWAGLVGPGVQNQGVNTSVWTDHTDWRPTILSLLGLKDDYVQDGRVVTEILAASANPQSLRLHRGVIQQLGAAYKQLNAPFGAFGMAILKQSTQALASNAAGDTTYTNIENQIASWTSQRDALAITIKNTLANSEFDNATLNVHEAQSLINQANALINEVVAAAS